MAARKERNTLKSNLLGTVISEAKMIGKNDHNREPTEEEVINVIKKFLKGINETITALQSGNRDTSKEITEKEILESFLPQQLSENDLKEKITSIINELENRSPQQMGKVMALLKERFPNQFDGKMASNLTKSLLS